MITVIEIENKSGLSRYIQDEIKRKIVDILQVYDQVLGDRSRILITPNLNHPTIEDMHEYNMQ